MHSYRNRNLITSHWCEWPVAEFPPIRQSLLRSNLEVGQDNYTVAVVANLYWTATKDSTEGLNESESQLVDAF